MKSSSRIEAGRVSVDDGAVPIVTAHGRNCPGPALVIVPSVFGVTDDLVEQMETLAADAALVVAMDLFWRTDPGTLPFGDMASVQARLQRLDFDRAYQDFRSVVDWARSQPACNGRILGLGICFGGPFHFRAAADGAVDAVVTWHGSRLHNYLDLADKIECPMVMHFGDSDRVAPMDTVEQIQAAFAGRPNVEIVVHAGADHGFAQPGAPTYQPEAAAEAIGSVRQLLRR